MTKIKQALTSKTVWVIVIAFLFNGLQAIQPTVPADYQVAVNGILSILAILAKLYPSKQY